MRTGAQRRVVAIDDGDVLAMAHCAQHRKQFRAKQRVDIPEHRFTIQRLSWTESVGCSRRCDDGPLDIATTMRDTERIAADPNISLLWLALDKMRDGDAAAHLNPPIRQKRNCIPFVCSLNKRNYR
ncbi:hypothetical protein PCAR4_60123 [Paraburkholderia caribensis]|nr:hypothetical protein PCAR4_60123 [Paraburkholderia caribensis]